MALGEILKRHHLPAGALSTRAVKQALIGDLERYEYKNRIVLTFVSVIVATLLVGTVLLAYLDLRSGATRLVPIWAASGVTMAGMLALMWRAGREWTKSHLVLGLARASSEEDVKKLVAKLIELAGRVGAAWLGPSASFGTMHRREWHEDRTSRHPRRRRLPRPITATAVAAAAVATAVATAVAASAAEIVAGGVAGGGAPAVGIGRAPQGRTAVRAAARAVLIAARGPATIRTGSLAAHGDRDDRGDQREGDEDGDQGGVHGFTPR